MLARGDNLPILRELPTGAFTLAYLDPPFNTGRSRQAERVRGVRSEVADGGRLGFRGQSYEVTRERTL